MLQNWLYRANVAPREKIHPGQHEAIIEPELWQAVQDRLAAGRQGEPVSGEDSLLSGKNTGNFVKIGPFGKKPPVRT